jgi:hypothetical protein
MNLLIVIALVVFPVFAMAAPSGAGELNRIYWCGKFIIIDHVQHIEAFLRDEHQEYFRSSQYIRKGGPPQPVLKLEKSNRAGIPALSFQTSPGHANARYEFSWFDDDVTQIDLAISDDGIHSASHEPVVAAFFADGALLLSTDHRFLALCRSYITSQSFFKMDSFLRSLQQPIDEIIDEIKSCEPLLVARSYRPIR